MAAKINSLKPNKNLRFILEMFCKLFWRRNENLYIYHIYAGNGFVEKALYPQLTRYMGGFSLTHLTKFHKLENMWNMEQFSADLFDIILVAI